jgi:hypothetical protein
LTPFFLIALNRTLDSPNLDLNRAKIYRSVQDHTHIRGAKCVRKNHVPLSSLVYPFKLIGSFRVQGSGFRVQGSGFRVQGSGFRVQDSWFRVQGSGFRVQDSWFRVQGSGFMV